MSVMAGLLVESGGGDVRGSVASVMYRDAPRLTADLTVLDIVLVATTSGVDADCDRLPTIRTADVGTRIRRAVAEWEVALEVEFLGVARVVVIECELHVEA